MDSQVLSIAAPTGRIRWFLLTAPGLVLLLVLGLLIPSL